MPASEPRNSIYPPSLRRGDTIALISSGSAIGRRHKVETLDVAIAALEELGYQVRVMPHARGHAPNGCAGTLEERVADLNTALTDPDIKMVMGTVGGGGTFEVVCSGLVDWDALHSEPKLLCGYSDLAYLSVAAYLQLGLITLDGPLAVFHFGCLPKPLDYGTESFHRVATRPQPAGQLAPPPQMSYNPFELSGPDDVSRRMHPPTPWRWLRTGKAAGRLLALTPVQVVAFLEAGFDLSFKDHIWCLDAWVGEAEYGDALRRVAACGLLDDVAGLVVGRPVNMEKEQRPATDQWDAALNDVLVGKEIPVLIDVDCGHTTPRLTVPNGVQATLDSESQVFHIDEAAVKG